MKMQVLTGGLTPKFPNLLFYWSPGPVTPFNNNVSLNGATAVPKWRINLSDGDRRQTDRPRYEK